MLEDDTANVFSQPYPLIGREPELRRMYDLFHQRTTRLLTLSGPGGIGKTRLALQAAHTLQPLFPGTIFFVPLVSITRPDLIPLIASALGITALISERPMEQVRDAVGDREILVVLDTMEHLTSAGPQLAELLGAVPGLNLLVTSRWALGLDGEYVLCVSSLRLPAQAQPLVISDLEQYTALQLFVARARAAKPTIPITPAALAAIAEICRKLDGLPLAIELAAARVRLFPPQALLAQLLNSSHLELLIDTNDDTHPRHKTLHNTTAWSYHLLDSADQRLLARLAVFADGATIPAITTICAIDIPGNETNPDAGVLNCLTSLVDHGLLLQHERADREPRFVLLETTRTFAWEQLYARGEADLLRERHAAYYAHMAELYHPQVRGPQQELVMARLEDERGNLRAALEWLSGQGRAEQSVRLAAHMAAFWMIRGYLSEGRYALESALAVPGPIPDSLRAFALIELGELARAQGAYTIAEGYCSESLTLYRRNVDKQGIANALNALGALAINRERLTRAQTYLEECLALRRILHYDQGIAWVLQSLGIIATRQGRYAVARTYLQESLERHRTLNHSAALGWVYTNLGNLALYQGRLEEAHSYLREGLALQRTTGNQTGVAIALCWLGSALLLVGDQAGATACATESVELQRRIGYRDGLAPTYELLCRLARQRGDEASAYGYARASLLVRHDPGNQQGTAATLEVLAELLADTHPGQAARLLGAASALRETRGCPLPPSAEPALEQVAAVARAQLGAAAFKAARRAGKSLDAHAAVTLALHTVSATIDRPTNNPDHAPASPAKVSPPLAIHLSERQLAVLRLVAQGLSNAEIAKRLDISPSTVNKHLTTIYRTIGVATRAAATRYAVEQHLV